MPANAHTEGAEAPEEDNESEPVEITPAPKRKKAAPKAVDPNTVKRAKAKADGVSVVAKRKCHIDPSDLTVDRPAESMSIKLKPGDRQDNVKPEVARRLVSAGAVDAV